MLYVRIRTFRMHSRSGYNVAFLHRFNRFMALTEIFRRPSLLLLPPLLALAGAAAAQMPRLDAEQIAWIGERIFANECNRRLECLTAWNEGEDFPSLGIGHFIWYRAGQEAGFTESFPALLRFMEARGAAVPAWIREADYEAPWPERRSFLAAMGSPRLRELRDFLAATIPLQTAFILERFAAAPQALAAAAAPERREGVARRFRAVAEASPPHGLFALIDYMHFKGEGTAAAERYQGQGWGLLQVLEAMPEGGADPLRNFSAAARRVLERRVANAPAERNEARWLPGWRARVDAYLPPTP